MIMNRLTQRERNIFVVCVTLAAVYIGYNFFYKPLIGNKDVLQNKMEKARKKILDNEKILRNAKKANEVYNQYQTEFKQPESNEQTISVLISNIEKEATQMGLTISDMKPKPVKQDKYFNTFSVTLSLEGSWTEILKLLHALQSKPYLLRVDEMNFDRASQVNTTFVRAYLVLSKVYIP